MITRNLASFLSKTSAASSRFFTTAPSKQSLPFNLPKLPLLTKMGELAKLHGFPKQRKTAVIGAQHLVATTASMLDVMTNILGIPPENMFLTGKCYSTSERVSSYLQEVGMQITPTPFPKKPSDYQHVIEESIRRMWEDFRQHAKRKSIEHAVILTDGGLPGAPRLSLVGHKLHWSAAEQTRFGLFSPAVYIHSHPLVNVAQSAVKVHAESVVVAKTGVRKIDPILKKIGLKKDQVCGIVGYGAVGHALAKHLLDNGYAVVVHEVDDAAFTRFGHLPCPRIDSLEELITLSDCVFGCTGTDLTLKINVRNLVKSDKFFISFSSGNIEFLSLLKEIRDNSLEVRPPMEDIICLSNTGDKICISNGGYPATFDGSDFAMEQEDSVLILALMLGAYIQARIANSKLIHDTSMVTRWQNCMLDPTIQNAVFSWWVRGKEHLFPDQEVVAGLQREEWIIAHSGGTYQPNPWLKEFFEDLLQSIPQESSKPTL